MGRGFGLFELNADLCTLLEAVASGNRKAFRTLYDKSAPVLFAICVRLMRDRDLARDVLINDQNLAEGAYSGYCHRGGGGGGTGE